MRIRTDGDKEHRQDTIEAAADTLDCNKTQAILVSCDVVGNVLDGVEEALKHPELSPRLRQELAETVSTRKVKIESRQPRVSVHID